MARPRQITDEQILQTMRAAVLEQGPAVSLDVVAEKLGVTGPALIKRFGTRQNLMLAALKPPETWPWVEKYQRSDARPIEVQLEELLTDIWEFFAEIIPCMMALRQSGIDPEKIQHSKMPAPLKGMHGLTRWIESARDAGLVEVADAETAAATMLGGLQFRLFSAHFAKQSLATRAHRHHLKHLATFFSQALAPRSSVTKPVKPVKAVRA